MRYSQESFDTLRKAYLRHSDTRKRCDYRECRQDARARQYQHDSALCSYFGFFHRERYANRSEKYGAGIIIPDRSIQRTARQVSQDAVEGLIPSETLISCRQQRMIRFKIYRRQFFVQCLRLVSPIVEIQPAELAECPASGTPGRHPINTGCMNSSEFERSSGFCFDVSE